MTNAASGSSTSVYLTPEFIRDIQESKHPGMARTAFKHIFDTDGTFKTDRNDHPYKGLTNGWIRWVQMSGVGLRLIYIKNDNKVYLYRVVGKSDEGGLKAPAAFTDKAGAGEMPEDVLQGIVESEAVINSRLLYADQPTYLRETIRRMYHLPQIEIFLISPTISQPLFSVSGEIGRFLDRSIEEGSRVVLLTAPSAPGEIPFFEGLARRNIEIYFTQNLRSRLFLFRVDGHRYEGPDKAAHPTAIIGSAELTHQSLDVGGLGRNEELCYRFPATHFEAFYGYAQRLVTAATDLQGHKIKIGALTDA